MSSNSYITAQLFISGGLLWLFKKFILFIIFGCSGSSLLARVFSSHSRRGCPLAAGCRLLALAASLTAERVLLNPGSVVTMDRLSCPAACGVLPDPGLNVSPVLAGRFLTTGPLWKSHLWPLNYISAISCAPVSLRCPQLLILGCCCSGLTYRNIGSIGAGWAGIWLAFQGLLSVNIHSEYQKSCSGAF